MGGSSQKTHQTQKTNQEVTLPEWMSTAGQSNFQNATNWANNNPVTAYTGPRVAQTNSNQNQAYNIASAGAGQAQNDLNTGRALTIAGATGPAMYTSTSPQALTQGAAALQTQAPTVGAETQDSRGYTASQAGWSGVGTAPTVQAGTAAAGVGSATMGQAGTGTASHAEAGLGTAGTAYSTDAQAALMQAAQRSGYQGYSAAMLDPALAPQVNAQTVGTKEWSDATAKQYMDPYLKNVQDTTLERQHRDQAEQLASLRDSLSVGSKAFGGTRAAVEEARLQGEQDLNNRDFLARSNSDAYTNAQGMFTSDQGRKLQADQGNQSSDLQAQIASGTFLDNLLGRNQTSENDARRFTADAFNTFDHDNAAFLQESNLTNANNLTNISDRNAQRATDISDRNAQRLTDTSNSNARNITDVNQGNANRDTDTSNSNARLATDMSNSNSQRLTDTSNSNARLETDVSQGNADRTLRADQSNQSTQSGYAMEDSRTRNQAYLRDADAADTAARTGADAWNTAQGANADRRQSAAHDTASFLDQMLGRNQSATNSMTTENMRAANSAADADANRDLSSQQTNAQVRQSMLDRLLHGGAQFGDFGVDESNLNTADINNLLRTGQVQQDTDQAQNDADYQEFLRMQNAGLDRYSTLAGILSGTPRNVTTSGDMTGDSVTKTNPGLLNQMMGIAQMGAAFASDRRLKRNIRKLGTLADGLGVYLYNYLWSNKPNVGVMADEVAALRPAALGPMIGPYRSVYYSKLEEFA